MKVGKRLIGLASLFAASVVSAGTISMTPVYLGSTTVTGVGTPPAGLVQQDFTTAAGHDPALIHWFKVNLDFTPANAGEDFRLVGFDVTRTAGVIPSTRAGVVGTTANKWLANTPTSPAAGVNTFSVNGDGGTAGDLLGIASQQTDPAAASAIQIGETGGELGKPSIIGYFTVKLASTGAESITLAEAPGPNVGFHTNNAAGDSTTFTTTTAGFTGATFNFAAAVGTVPEPTLLGVAAAGLSFVGARRRRA